MAVLSAGHWGLVNRQDTSYTRESSRESQHDNEGTSYHEDDG